MADNNYPNWYQKIKDFPIIGEFLTALGGAIVAHLIIEKEGKKTLNPAVIRTAAPHFAKDQADEAAFARIIQMIPDEGERKAIRETWMPTMGKHQRADFILSTAEMTVGQTEKEKKANLELTVAHLRDFARIPDNDRRTIAADGQNFLQHLDENDYLIVKIENAVGTTFHTLEQFQDFVLHSLESAWNFVKANAPAAAQQIAAAAKAAGNTLADIIVAGAKATAAGAATAAQAVANGTVVAAKGVAKGAVVGAKGVATGAVAVYDADRATAAKIENHWLGKLAKRLFR